MYLDRMTGLIMLGAKGGGGSAGGGSCKFYECASVDDGGSWSGYEWLLTATEGGECVYTKSETLTEGLPWTSVKPKVGKSYSEDALIAASFLYAGEPFKPLTLTAEEAGSTVTLNAQGNPTTDGIEYRTGLSGVWESYTIGTTITLNEAGDSVQFQNRNTELSNGNEDYVHFSLTGRIAASGSIQSMLNYVDYCTDWCFYKLFAGNTALTSAPELTASRLASSCYYSMFEGDSNVTKAPVLNAEDLKPNCYYNMVIDTGITSISLPAKGLVTACYGAIAARTPLSYIEVGFSEWVDGACAWWLDEVAYPGTFVCPPDLPEMRGSGYIPYGWNIVRRTAEPEQPEVPDYADLIDDSTEFLLYKGLTDVSGKDITVENNGLTAKSDGIYLSKERYAVIPANALPATVFTDNTSWSIEIKFRCTDVDMFYSATSANSAVCLFGNSSCDERFDMLATNDGRLLIGTFDDSVFGWSIDTEWHTWKITHSSDNVFTHYFDETQKSSQTKIDRDIRINPLYIGWNSESSSSARYGYPFVIEYIKIASTDGGNT